MTEIVDQPNYTVPAAAARTGRTVRTIRQWIRDGMNCRNIGGYIVIDHDVLMANLRANAKANPSVKGRCDTP
jgi:hypothetical protein